MVELNVRFPSSPWPRCREDKIDDQCEKIMAASE
jgi:hypothetical protein